jgi:ATP-dependent protease ClpP protease subunit
MRQRDLTSPVSPLPNNHIDWEKDKPYTFQGLTIVIEFLAGDTRTKISKDGYNVDGVMPSAYGFILGTTDAHGEEIDMYLSSYASDTDPIFVIDQVNVASGQFDEHKVMLGFGSSDEVQMTYESVFGDGSGKDRLGVITSFTNDAFLSWLKSDGSSLKPAFEYKRDGVTSVEVAGIVPFVKPNQDRPAPRDEAGGVIIALPDVVNGPRIKTVCSTPGEFNYHLVMYSPLDMRAWTNTVDTLCRLLELARETDTCHIHLACPGGSVVLMGRIISAINRTKAKVITYAEGGVASAATAIWAAGHERHIRPGSYFMQHMSSQLLAGKTTDISAKAIFAVNYITDKLARIVKIGLFTQEEVSDMIDKSADIYISGREAIARVGAISGREQN